MLRNGPPNKAATPEAINSRYTGKTMGTKRNWSKEGMERFDSFAVLVYNNRRARGKEFDQWFRLKMLQSNGNQHQTARRASIKTEEVVNAAPTIV